MYSYCSSIASTLIIQCTFLNSHIEGKPLDPYQASLADGARVADVCEAITQSAKEQKHIKLIDRK